MSVNIKQNGELVKIANNVSIVQADWNDRENTDKKSCIKNQPETIKTMADLKACEDENALAGAMAVVEALDYQNISNKTNAQYATLEGFVTDTATDINIPHIGRCKDISENGWLGKAPFNYGNHWYRYVITYQDYYVSGSSASIYGNGIFWNQVGRMFNVLIEGNKDTGLTVTYQVLNIPSIKTREDLMANTGSGLFPDALAVKDAIKYISVAKNSAKQYATLEEFVEITATDISVPNMGRFKDIGGFTVAGSVKWYRYIMMYQNPYKEGVTSSVEGNGIFWDDAERIWNVRISGNKDTGLNKSIKRVITENELNDNLFSVVKKTKETWKTQVTVKTTSTSGGLALLVTSKGIFTFSSSSSTLHYCSYKLDYTSATMPPEVTFLRDSSNSLMGTLSFGEVNVVSGLVPIRGDWEIVEDSN